MDSRKVSNREGPPSWKSLHRKEPLSRRIPIAEEPPSRKALHRGILLTTKIINYEKN